MAIEKRKLRSGKEVGWDTARKCYCPLPKELSNAPISATPLDEKEPDELKAILDSKGIQYHWNAGKDKLLALVKEAQER